MHALYPAMNRLGYTREVHPLLFRLYVRARVLHIIP